MEVAEVWGERRIFKEDQGHPCLVEATSLNIWIFQFRCNQTLFPRTVLDNSEVRLDQMFVASLVGAILNTDTLLFHDITIYIDIIKYDIKYILWYYNIYIDNQIWRSGTLSEGWSIFTTPQSVLMGDFIRPIAWLTAGCFRNDWWWGCLRIKTIMVMIVD